MANTLSDRSRTLVDEFFFKEDQKLIQRMREIKKMEETAATLSQVSGIRNETILKKLVELNVPPETLAAAALIPLVETAWADGMVDEKERAAIIQAAEKGGASEVQRSLVDEWLKKKPEPRLFKAWTVYMEGLCGELSQAQINALKVEVTGNARMVAEASGGVLGMGFRISAKEEAVLKKIDAAFKR